MFKVGLIGCGYMGTMHANCYKALSDKVEVVAVADVRAENAKEIADMFGATIYNDAESLINNAEVDYIDICLPTYLHERYAVMAMKKGFDVFVEKPLCRTNEEAQNLIKVQEETGRTVQVGQVIRFWDEYAWLKDVKEKGTYGKLISATFRRLSSRPDWAWEGWLHDSEKSGGMALDLHIHDIDFMRYLMGEPKCVKAVGQEEAPGLTEHIITSYIYDDAVLNAEGSWSYPSSFKFSMAFCVKFEKATVCHDSATGEFIVYMEDGSAFEPTIDKANVGTAGKGNVSSLGGYYNELNYFLELLKNPALVQVASLKEGARSVELALEGIEKSTQR
ncbi:MAG: Gfo/Idh/MocA family oxidoreductase [Clostridia bacterium]|nr:Gfo/Idh/MocA family oxidoreductase [Clostridia bacterium]MBQ8637492.1 Gfo/Idh/MocA family oxidoreductase [Clostridia bacterium]